MSFACSAGQLRHRVNFQRRQAADDGFGNQSGSWADLYGPVPARVRALNGREQILAGKLTGIQPYEIVVYSTSGSRAVTSGDRAVNASTGEIFDITSSSDPDGENVWWVLIAKTGTAETF